MPGGWSSLIDPIQLADKGARLSGALPLKGMRRLAELCLDDTGSVTIDLQFERSHGLRMMHGTIDARVRLTCQRCMESFESDLKTRPRLLLLRHGERDELLGAGDVLVVEKPVAISAIVEDELLLVMPMVPIHPAENCPATPPTDRSDEKEQTRPHPFSVLDRLKRTDR